MRLTKSEKEVLDCLTKEFLTVKKVARRRKTSDKAVYKIMKKLREKGVISGSIYQGLKKNSTHTPISIKFKKVRCHGQEFNLKIRIFGNYKPRSKTILFKGNRIRFYRNSIEVYSKQSFVGDSAEDSHFKSIPYWNLYFRSMEGFFKIKFGEIKEVFWHYSELNNELAQDCNERKEKISIKAPEDNKEWLKIDHSFKIDELETTHPKTAMKDMDDAVRPFFNDLRLNKPPNLSEIMILVKDITKINKDTAAGLNSIITLLTPGEKIERKTISKEKPEYIG